MLVSDLLPLLGVRPDRFEDVGIALDAEVEAPAAIHTRLPEAARLVVLLGAQARVPEIAEELAELLAECPLDVGRRRGELASERFGDQYAPALVVGRTLSAHGRLGAHW